MTETFRLPGKVIPIELFPADWCLECNHPGHGGLEKCGMMGFQDVEWDEDDETVEPPMYETEVLPCECKVNLVIGKRGELLVRVVEVQGLAYKQ